MATGTADAVLTPTATSLDSVTIATAYAAPATATVLVGDTTLTPTPTTLTAVTVQSPQAVPTTPASYPVTAFTPTTPTVAATIQLTPSAGKAAVNTIVGAAHYTIPEPIRRWDGTSWTYQYKPRP